MSVYYINSVSPLKTHRERGRDGRERGEWTEKGEEREREAREREREREMEGDLEYQRA
jgi:hypothetical protein